MVQIWMCTEQGRSFSSGYGKMGQPVQPIWPVFSYQLRHPTSPLCRYLFENLLFCDWFIQKFIGMLAFSLSPSTLILDPTTRWQLMTYTNHLLAARHQRGFEACGCGGQGRLIQFALGRTGITRPTGRITDILIVFKN